MAVYYGALDGSDKSQVRTVGGDKGTTAGAVGTVYWKASGGTGELRIAGTGKVFGMWTPLGLSDQTVYDTGEDRVVLSGTNVVAEPEHQLLVKMKELVLRKGERY